jgi:hypothetical protein
VPLQLLAVALITGLKLIPLVTTHSYRSKCFCLQHPKSHYGLECYAHDCTNFNFAFFPRKGICRWLKATDFVGRLLDPSQPKLCTLCGTNLRTGERDAGGLVMDAMGAGHPPIS